MTSSVPARFFFDGRKGKRMTPHQEGFAFLYTERIIADRASPRKMGRFPPSLLLIWALVVFALLPLVVQAQQQEPGVAVDEEVVNERELLTKFYVETQGGGWKRADNWGSQNGTVCEWYGITCDGTGQHVTQVNLRDNHLVAHFLPGSIYRLPKLEVLNLAHNLIGGANFQAAGGAADVAPPLHTIDFTACLLKQVTGISVFAPTLKTLKLSENEAFRDTGFPMGLLSLTALETLHMVDNHMIGPLPSALFVNHRRLQELLLQGNSWTGTMPTEIGLLGDIKVLSLADHAFTGGIPTELNQLRQLEQINLAGPGKAPPGGAGRLTGALPSLDQAIRLQTVLLSNNALTGHIPNNFLQYCNEELSITVDLHNNLLTGQLPGALTRFDALDIDLTGNQFVGPLPDSICSLDRWMDGAVGRYGCDAILCSAGSYSPTGRQETDRDPCRECRASTVEKDAETKTRLGATTCVWGDVDTGKVSEARILAELYVATAGPTNWEQTWPPLDSFLKERDFEDIDWSLLDNSICEWHGVICNGQGHVEILTLGSNKLVGTIPESLFYLPSLVSLDLSYNRVTFDTTHPAGSGTGLEALQHAAQLTRLRMSHTQVRSLRGIGKGSATLTEVFFDGCDFQSPIPRELYDMTKLHTLHLEASFLTGTIAPDIKKLVNLKRLSLNENKLTGSLPKDITELRSLEYLDLSDNDFGGEVPPEFDHLPSGLLSLKINSARGGLGGKLPSFKGLKDVEELELAFNALTGEMPADFLSERRTAGTIKVRLTGNQLTGKLPLGLSVFSSLIIEIEDNMITDIPYALCENQDWMGGEVGLASAEEACTAILCPIGYWSPHGRAVFSENVKCTKCEGNSFMGETVCETKGLRRNREVEVLDLLYSATGGRYWNKTHTNWTKPGVPICYREGVFCGYKPADMNSGVTELRLNDYGLRGRIPNEIWELPLLRRLDVSHCPVDLSFDGIEKAPIIQILQLAGTDVSSLKGIENAGEKLKDLYVSDAGLKGSFPTELLRLISLKTMQLDGNKLSGSIPPEIGGLKNLQSVALQDNDLFGPLPREIGTLSLLKNLDVSDNRLSGLLPSELENVAKLESLRLANQRSENKLEGSVLTFSSNPVLHDVDLSGNAFSGTIPATMLSGVDHSAAIKIDLSENELTGSFPVEFRSFQKLEINLAANMIGELSAEVCTNFEWQNGIVGVVPQGKECDAILCPPGTAEIHGRQMHRDSPCQPCSSREEAPFFGSKICLDPFARKEREALFQLSKSTSGSNWFNNDNWLSDLHVCSWYGVICDELDWVTELRLSRNGLEETGPDIDVVKILSGLSNLKVLNLDGNKLSLNLNSIPQNSVIESLTLSHAGLDSLEGVGHAKNLRQLVASNNNLAGSVPGELFNLSDLIQVDLSQNGLEGTLDSFTALTNLKVLSLSDNKFQGSIPKLINRLSNLKAFSASENLLSGTIPKEINELRLLERLSLHSQHGLERIEGSLPDFAQSSEMRYVDLANNDISGEIPSSFLAGVNATKKAVVVILEGNNIGGTVPLSLERLEQLDINLADNRIEALPNALCKKGNWLGGLVGKIRSCDAILCPGGFYSAEGRQTSPDRPCMPCDSETISPFLGQTTCTETSERSILEDIYSIAGGERWKGNSLWMTDSPICSWLGVECEGSSKDDKGIKSLNLESNNMIGRLPMQAWSLPFLRELNLRGNEGLHVSLLGVSKTTVEYLYLSGTKTETLDGISHLKSLRILEVDGMTGPFPSELFDLADNLEVLDLSQNYFVGTIPTRIGELTGLTQLLVTGNDLHGTLPKEVGELTNLEELVLDENLLSGSLPNEELSSLSLLKRFSVSRKIKSGRKLSGPLPNFNQVPKLISLALDGNELSGTIPPDFLLASLSVGVVDLSGNSLTGTVPTNVKSLEGLQLILDGNKLSNVTLQPMKPEVDERKILTDFFQATGGSTWIRNDFWKTSVDYCDWYGVGCADGHVILLNLEANNVTGKLPQKVFDLPELQVLWLNSNPIELSFENARNAANLLELKMDGTKVRSLLGLGLCKSLTSLEMRSISLDGSFPQEVLELPNLRVLYMSNNSFTGPLPPSLAAVPYLRVLELDENAFSGTLSAFNDSVALTSVNLAFNKLSGSIPHDFLDRVPSFTSLSVYLQGNDLTGAIPEEFQRFENLNIDLHNNKIDAMPNVLCKKSSWNDGDVGTYGCDALLCPPGTTNVIGRSSFESQKCDRCRSAVPYFGQVDCVGHSAAFSGRHSTASGRALILFLMIAPGLGLLWPN